MRYTKNPKLLFITVIALVIIYVLYGPKTKEILSNSPKPHAEKEFVLQPKSTRTYDELEDHELSLIKWHKTTKPSFDETKKLQKPVDVNVNYLKSFRGLEIHNELYVPFSFLKDYYEISGEFLDANNVDDGDEPLHFLWLQVNRTFLNVKKLSFPKYNVEGAYLMFHESDVSNRARVKCISGLYEVPVTTQWDPNGYYYPTQIAQYGLSHLSKFYKDGKRKPKQKTLKIPANIKGEYKLSRFPKDSSSLFTLKLKFVNRLASFTVKVLASDNREYDLIYKTDDTLIKRSDTKTEITYGIGVELTDKNIITRDLQVDLVKGLSFRDGKKAGNTVNTRISKLIYITFDEVEVISSGKLLDQDHEAKFMSAADWFVKFQDSNGGWKVNVRRVIFKGMEADAGWYSAMGQGQAISLLSRVFSYTNNEKYLNAALAATKVFHKSSNEEGVKVMLFHHLPWYEEYPTTPPSFVLNGFIYSLFGLYDLAERAGPVEAKAVIKLFNDGFNTLEKALPLFDNGYGTFYDLRHISIPGHEPNRARWQYHRIHLEQLSALIDITNSKVLKNILPRWTGYASGILSRHN